MARPVKKDVERFLTKTKLLYDTRIKALRRNFKETNNANNAFFVFDYLFREIFGNEGYYIKYTEDLVGDTADFCYVTESFVDDVIQRCIELELFDQRQFERNKILTSRAIQREYQNVFAAMKRTAKIDSGFCVLDEKVSSENSGRNPQFLPRNQEENPIVSEETPEFAEETPTRERDMRERERERSVFHPQIFDSDSDSEDQVQDPFTAFREYWNLKAKTEKRVKMSPITELIASSWVAHNLLSRMEEHGGDIEVIFIAIDRIADAEFFYGKKLGVTMFLKDSMFPKFLNMEWEDFKK